MQSFIAVFSLGVNGAKIVAEVSGKVGGSNHNNRALFSDITEENYNEDSFMEHQQQKMILLKMMLMM